MDAILLAAGLSKRFGSNKLLHTINHQPMYKHMLDLLYSLVGVSIDHLIVVTQYQEIYDDTLDHYTNATPVVNPHPEYGISSSIGIALSNLLEINPASSSCIFAVADQPYLTASSLEKLISRYSQDTEHDIAACSHNGVLGNPVVFSHVYYNDLLSLTGDVGGKCIIKKHLREVQSIEISKHELEDIDENIS